ncbi:MAG: hypothetical protein ACRD21_25560 [Vicinamibacteria bacterium]
MTEGTVGTGNTYCDRLETLRIPRVEEFVGRRVLLGPANLFDLMIVALPRKRRPHALRSRRRAASEGGSSLRGF